MNIRIKRLLLIIAMVLLISFVVFMVYLKYFRDNSTSNKQSVTKDTVIYNNNSGVVESKVVSGIVFSNIKCYYDGSNSIISYDVTNTKDEEVTVGKYHVDVYDDNDEIIYTLNSYSDVLLKSNETYMDALSTVNDLSKAKKIEILLDE